MLVVQHGGVVYPFRRAAMRLLEVLLICATILATVLLIGVNNILVSKAMVSGLYLFSLILYFELRKYVR